MTPKYSPGPDPGTGKAVQESFKFKGRIYELRRNSCGKRNCRTCRGRDARHGPYWYLCVPYGGKWRRIYIGKDLDTTKYIGQDGKVDHAMMGKGSERPKAALSPDNEEANPRSTGRPTHLDQTDLLDGLEDSTSHISYDPGKTPNCKTIDTMDSPI